MPLQGSLAFVSLLALVPAVVRLWGDRAMARLLDDPALPERLLARRKQQQIVVVLCSVLIGAARPHDSLWTVPVLVVADLLAAYPFRRRLYDETWSVAAYLSFFCRLIVASFGFWILLALTPTLGGVYGTPPWVVPAGVAIALFAWNERQPEMLRFLMRTQPVTDPVLLPRFEALARASTAPMPQFEYVDLGGGVLANAFALPSLRQASVIFTDTLLARMEPDESVAICAHEVAHLEYYDRRKMRALTVVTRVLVIAAGTLVPLAGASGPVLRMALWWSWPVALLSALIWRAKDRQRNETASDQRAVALTGNAEALAGGLTKLYAWGHMPRRVDRQHEQRATHPSLARRIRDIRAAGGAAPALPVASSSFAAATGGTRATFEPTRLRWIEGDAEHSLSYAALTELRVDARASGAPRLVAVDRAGHRWQMPLATADAAQIQAVLDTVDGQLAHPAHASSFATGRAGRLYMVLAAVLALTFAQFAAAAVVFLAFVQPAASLIASSGAACLTAALLAWRDGAPFSTGVAPLLAIVGASLLWIAYRRRNDDVTGSPGRPLAIIAVLAAISMTLVLAGGVNAVRLHQSSRAIPSAPVLFVALATAMATSPRRALRRPAVAAAVVGLALAVAGSMTFLERVGRDPLLVPVENIQSTTIASSAPIADFTLPFIASDLTLSQHGTSFIAVPDEDEDLRGNDESGTLQAGRVGGAPIVVRADEAVFSAEDRILAVRFRDEGADLRELSVDPGAAELWRARIDGLSSGDLSVQPGTRHWRLLGRDREKHIVRAEGDIGTPGVSWTRWPSAGGRYGWLRMAASAHDVVAMEKHYERGPFSGTSLQAFTPLLLAMRSESIFWRVPGSTDAPAPAGRSRLEVDCVDGALDGALVCAAYDGVRTRMSSIDTISGRVVPLVGLPGRFVTYGSRVANGWMTGWNDARPIALRLATRQALVMPRVRGVFVRALAAADSVVAALSMDDSGSRVRLYPIPKP